MYGDRFFVVTPQHHFDVNQDTTCDHSFIVYKLCKLLTLGIGGLCRMITTENAEK